MVDLDEAARRCRANVTIVGSETVELDAALGRILREPLCSRWPLPVHDHAAMDGYGVRVEDLADASPDAPRELEVVDVAAPGGPEPAPLEPGRAVRILTGARIPAGVTSVIKQEDVERISQGGGQRVRVFAPAERGRNIRWRGEDVQAGRELVAAGTLIDPDVITALASFGVAEVTVSRTLRVAILTCGDELVRVADAGPDRVVDVAGPTIAAGCRQLGAQPRQHGPAPDQLEALQATLDAALADQPEVLITIGGASVGDRDLIAKALDARGVAWVFRGVQVKPGKPTALARLGDLPVFVLPGNPGAARVMFNQLVAPAIMAMQGRSEGPPLRSAITTVALHRARDRATVLQARALDIGGRLRIDHTLGNTAARVSPRLDANASLVLPPGPEPLPPGSIVELALRREPERRPLPPVLAFVGLSGSGKTTVIVRLLERLADLRVGVVKHGRHFDLDKPGKDSDRFRAAGASAVTISSAKLTATLEHDAGTPSVHELLARLPIGLELILVEGFKTAALPSIEVHRDDRPLLCTEPGFEHIIGFVSNHPELAPARLLRFDSEELEPLEQLVRARVLEQP